MNQTKTCVKCNLTLPFTEFSAHKTTVDGYDQRCKICVSLVRDNSDRKRYPRELDLQDTDMNSNKWQGGKYAGTLFQRDNTPAWIAACGGKQKSFNPKNHNNSDEVAKLMADKWRKMMSDKLKSTKNKYKLIDNKYLIVQLSKGYVTLCDIDQLDFVKNHTLFVSHCGSNDNYKNYCAYWDNKNDKNLRFHRQVRKVNNEVIDHINGYPLDNRKCNLRDTTYHENNINKSKVSHVNTEYLDDGKVKVYVYVNIPGKKNKKVVTKILPDKKYINKYVNLVTQKIDKVRANQHIQKQKKEYEDIMIKHADDFKWRDLIITENDEKDEEQDKNKEIINHQQDRLNIYNKFKQVCSEFNLSKERTEQICKNKRIRHIDYDNITYKFCHTCETWQDISSYTNDSGKWDNKSTLCGECSRKQKTAYRNNNPEIMKSWKERNKEHVQEYNKTYGEQYRKENKDKLNDYFKEHYRKKQAAKGKKVVSGGQRKQKFFQRFKDKVELQNGTCIGTVTDYQNAHSKISVKCNNDHTFSITWNNLSKNKWCAQCYLASRKKS